jgi:hypothetical protein
MKITIQTTKNISKRDEKQPKKSIFFILFIQFFPNMISTNLFDIP